MLLFYLEKVKYISFFLRLKIYNKLRKNRKINNLKPKNKLFSTKKTKKSSTLLWRCLFFLLNFK